MDKFISCWKITEKCYYVAQAETVEEALKKLAEHAESAHHMALSKDMVEKAKTLLREAA